MVVSNKGKEQASVFIVGLREPMGIFLKFKNLHHPFSAFPSIKLFLGREKDKIRNG
jgi:hypothetical protein